MTQQPTQKVMPFDPAKLQSFLAKKKGGSGPSQTGGMAHTIYSPTFCCACVVLLFLFPSSSFLFSTKRRRNRRRRRRRGRGRGRGELLLFHLPFLLLLFPSPHPPHPPSPPSPPSSPFVCFFTLLFRGLYIVFLVVHRQGYRPQKAQGSAQEHRSR